MNLEARIERLERVNRRWRTMAIVVGTLLVTAAMMGQAQPRKPQALQAERFVVVDGEGKERAVLGMDEEAPTLWLNNRHGKPVLLVEVPKVVDQPGVFFLDADGKTRMELALTPGGPVLHLSDPGKLRARVATNELNAPLVGIYDDAGKTLFEVSASKPVK